MDVLLRVDGRYVCWHSYEARWYLGPKRLSEWFSVDFHAMKPKGRMQEALDHFPTAQFIWRRS